MFLRDFTKERGVKYNTVYVWLKRQPWFEKYTKKVDDKIYLEKKAVDMLKEKYPLEIEKENSLEKQLIEAQQTIIKLQAMLYESQSKLLLLEDLEEKNKEVSSQLYHAQLRISNLQEEYDLANKIRFKLDDEVEDLKDERRELKGKLEEKEKQLSYERAKSWWDKLLKR